jgi:hypothetical protein
VPEHNWCDGGTIHAPNSAKCAAFRAHAKAVADGADGYDDPTTGLFVFTSAFLSQRACCDNGCRHCPYSD